MKRTDGVPSGGAVKKILNNIDEKNKTQVSQNENDPIKISNAEPRTTDGLAVEKQADYAAWVSPLQKYEDMLKKALGMETLKLSDIDPAILTEESNAIMDALRNGKKLSDIDPAIWKNTFNAIMDAIRNAKEKSDIDPPSDAFDNTKYAL